MIIDGTEYEVLIATDTDNDSMQWECYSTVGAKSELLLEVIRFDGRKEWVFIQHAKQLPLGLVEYAVSHAKDDLGPFFNG